MEGQELLDDIASTIQRFVVLPAHARDAAALWVLHAYAHDAAEISPIITVTSPEKRCGKTTLGTVLGALVPRALHTAKLLRLYDISQKTLRVGITIPRGYEFAQFTDPFARYLPADPKHPKHPKHPSGATTYGSLEGETGFGGVSAEDAV